MPIEGEFEAEADARTERGTVDRDVGACAVDARVVARKSLDELNRDGAVERYSARLKACERYTRIQGGRMWG